MAHKAREGRWAAGPVSVTADEPVLICDTVSTQHSSWTHQRKICQHEIIRFYVKPFKIKLYAVMAVSFMNLCHSLPAVQS